MLQHISRRSHNCSAALELLSALGHILEVGAGVGYWALKLREMGVYVMASDLHPPGDSSRNLWHRSIPLMTEVQPLPSLGPTHSGKLVTLLCVQVFLDRRHAILRGDSSRCMHTAWQASKPIPCLERKHIKRGGAIMPKRFKAQP